MARTTKAQPQPKAKLTDVHLHEISFVGKGDNPEAHIVLLKSRTESASVTSLGKEYKGNEQDEVLHKWLTDNKTLVLKGDGDACTFDEIVANREIRSQMWDLVYTLEDSISSIVNDGTVSDKTAMIQQSVSQFSDAITALTKGEVNMPLAKITKERDEVQAQVETLKAENEALKTKPAAGEVCKVCGHKAEGTDPLAAIDKSALPEAVCKMLDEQAAQIEKNAKETALLKEAELTREYIGKAADCVAIGKVDEVADVLKSIAKLDAGVAEKVHGLLKSASARLISGELFKENGKSVEGGAAGVTAADKITQKAKELLNSDPTIGTIEKAWTKVYDTDTALRTEYINERKH